MKKFQLEFEVRDYECDLQGIVNNARYLNYLEHTRHKFLLGKGIDFAKLHDEGIDLIVSRVEIDYKHSLRSGDCFVVRLSVHREGFLRVVFEQEVIKLPEEKLAAKARVIGVGVRNGRPLRVDSIPGFDRLLVPEQADA